MRVLFTLFLLLAVSPSARAQQSPEEWKGKQIRIAPVTKDGKALWTITVEEANNVGNHTSLGGKLIHKDGTEGKLLALVVSEKQTVVAIEDAKGKIALLKGKLSKDLVFTGTLDKKATAVLEERRAKEKGDGK